MKNTKHLLTVCLDNADVDFDSLFDNHESISFMVYALHEHSDLLHYHVYVEMAVGVDCDKLVSWIENHIHFKKSSAQISCFCDDVKNSDLALSYIERNASVVTILKRK